MDDILLQSILEHSGAEDDTISLIDDGTVPEDVNIDLRVEKYQKMASKLCNKLQMSVDQNMEKSKGLKDEEKAKVSFWSLYNLILVLVNDL